MNTLTHKFTRALAAIPLSAGFSLLLILAVVLQFGPALNFEFLNYDDPQNIYENLLVTQFAPAKLSLIWSNTVLGLYIPLTYTVWGILARVSAWLHPTANPSLPDPAVFHAANILLHAGTVLVVFAILRLLLRRDWPAAAGALLFALHPLQISSVAWISELKGLLAGLLGLLAIWQYLVYIMRDQATNRRRRSHYVVATIFYLAALLAKPSVVTVPLMAAILAVALLQRNWRRVAVELSPWLLLALPLIVITKDVQPSGELNFLPNLGQRFLVAGDAIAFYLGKILWPFGLGPDYGRSPQTVLASGWVYLNGVWPYPVTALLIWRVRRPWLVAGLLLFIAALLPVLGFIPFMFQAISTVADRYLYLALLAPALLVGRTLCLYPGRRPAAIATILLILLALCGAEPLRAWHDSLTFNLRAVKLNPRSSLAYNNLGVAYKEQHRIPEAVTAFREAIANAHGHTPAYANLGNIYADSGSPEEAKAYYLKDLELKPASNKVYLMLGTLASKNGQPLEALDCYQKALAIDPGFAPTYTALGMLYAQLGNIDAAMTNYRRALEIDPNLADAHNNLGLLYEMTNRQWEAIAAYRQAIVLMPAGSDAYNNLGRLLLDANRPEEALPLLQQAADNSPGQLDPANNLALAYLRLGKSREAAAWFRRVLLIDPSYAPARENLVTAEVLDKTTRSGHPGESKPAIGSNQQ
jgi:Tfp pilus assembly protein PilF